MSAAVALWELEVLCVGGILGVASRMAFLASRGKRPQRGLGMLLVGCILAFTAEAIAQGLI